MVTTYNISEFKSRASEILRELKDGDEVIITRRGKPCGKLTPVHPSYSKKPSLATLRGAITQLPYATYQDFLDIKKIWAPRELKFDGGADQGTE